MAADLTKPGKSFHRGQILMGMLDRLAREGKRTGSIVIEIDYQKGFCQRARHQMRGVEAEHELPDALLDSG